MHSNMEAIAARPLPIANVTEIVRSTLIPIRRAASLSSEQARMALPIFVLPVNAVRASMMTMQQTTVTMET